MIFDGEKKVYILSEQEYDEMFDGEAHANLELIKVRKQLQEANEAIMSMVGNGSCISYEIGQSYLDKWILGVDKCKKKVKYSNKP